MTFDAPTPDLLGLDDNWPRPGWVVLDAARTLGFSGEIEFETFPRLRVYVDLGQVYLAERVSDPPVGTRLVSAGALSAEELEQGSIRIGDSEHLGRLFDRTPSIDRHAVMATLEAMNDEATAWVANQLVPAVNTTAYRHHASAVHVWLREPARTPASGDLHPLPPPPPDAVPSPGPSPWMPLGDVEHLGDDVRIEWAESTWLSGHPDDARHAPTRPLAPPPIRLPLAPPAAGEGAEPITEPVAVTLAEGDDEAGPTLPVAGADDRAAASIPGAFELIWPTGEIDEQFLGGPLSDVPSPAEPLGDVAAGEPVATGAGHDPQPVPLQLTPLSAPTDEPELSGAGHVSDDVVLAIQRAIAAIGAESATAWEPASDAQLAPRRGTTAVVDGPATRGSAAGPAGSTAIADAPHTESRSIEAPTVASLPAPAIPTLPAREVEQPAPGGPSGERRSALRRLISGLRRR